MLDGLPLPLVKMTPTKLPNADNAMHANIPFLVFDLYLLDQLEGFPSLKE